MFNAQVFSPISRAKRTVSSSNLNPILLSYSAYKRGWGVTGEGKEFNSYVINTAQMLYNLLAKNGFKDIEFVPGYSGEVTIACDFDEYFSEIIVFEDQSFGLILELNGEEVLNEYSLSFEDLIGKLQEVSSKWQTLTSGSWIHNITLKEGQDILVQHLDQAAKMGGFLSSARNAQSPIVRTYAGT